MYQQIKPIKSKTNSSIYTLPWIKSNKKQLHQQTQQSNWYIHEPTQTLQKQQQKCQAQFLITPNKFELWTNKIKQKEQDIILSYLNLKLDKSKKKKKNLSLFQNRIHYSNTNISQKRSSKRLPNQINPVSNKINFMSNKINPLPNRINHVLNRINPVSNSYRKNNCSILLPKKKNFINNPRQMSMILKQKETLQKQKQLIEQLQQKVDQIEKQKLNSIKLQEPFEKKTKRYKTYQQDNEINNQVQNNQIINKWKQMQKINLLKKNKHQNSFEQIQIIKPKDKSKLYQKICHNVETKPQILNKQQITNRKHNISNQSKLQKQGIKNSHHKSSLKRIFYYENQDQRTLINKVSSQFSMKQSQIQTITNIKINFPFRLPSLQFLNVQNYYYMASKQMQQNNCRKLSSPSKRCEQYSFAFPQLPSEQNLHKFIASYVPETSKICIQSLMSSPRFKIIYNIQQPYLIFGQFIQSPKNLTKHGFLIQLGPFYLSQSIYQQNKKINGIQITKIGRYQGQFKDNKKHGKGDFVWTNGETYQGNWKLGKKHGQGRWQGLDGQQYHGQWSHGKVQGYGIHTSPNGQLYEGSFQNYLKQGWGKEFLPNGDSYQGQFQAGKPHGKGVYRWKQGHKHQGHFIEGFRQNLGIFTDAQNNIYQGQFWKEKASGLCEIKFSNGDHYEGIIDKGFLNARGKLMLFKQKQIWNGFWCDGQFVSSNI